MKNYNIIFYSSILLILILSLTGCKDNNNTYSNISNNTSSENTNAQSAENRIAQIIQNASTEEVLSEYSTIIKDNSEGRLTNINLTCNILNNTIIHNGETFSFNDIVGQPTSERGYQEASIIIDGETKTGIGGGNCQVSSTIYNAVLNISGLNITERHEHGKEVTYVPKGQDAAVSYGSLDLKFENSLGYDIKLEVTTDNSNINVRIIKI